MVDVVKRIGLVERVNTLREGYAYRDRAANIVQAVRDGDFDRIDPDAFNEDWQRPIVANLIDTYAKHAGAALSPLPMVRCRPTARKGSQRAQARADLRTKIVQHYIECSKVQRQMQFAADQFYTYGLVVSQVKPDLEEKVPEIILRDSLGFYPVWNYKGETVEAAHVFTKRYVDLVAQYPELEHELRRGKGFRQGSETVEVYHHDDGKTISLFVADTGLVLHEFPNPVGKCLFTAAAYPNPNPGKIRGVFDDLVFVQLARNQMQMMMLEATEQAVDAPVVAPLDVSDVPVGPGAIVRTNNPAGVGRLSMNVPSEAFAAVDHFKTEMQSGAITPEALGGSIDASVVTGKGVQELMAGYSQQIANAQLTLAHWFEETISKALRLDEKLWPDDEKEYDALADGASYTLRYTPSKDIGGDFKVDVSYGTSTGLDPNRHLVWVLQQMGAGLLAKDTAIREMPGHVNPGEELSKVQVEQGRDAIMAAVAGLAQSIPGIIAQGGDASMVMQQVAAFVDGLEKGIPLEELAKKVWAPPEPEPEQQDPMAALMGGMGGPEAAMGGGGGAMPSIGQNPDSDLQMMFSGLSASGDPNLSATVSRRAPAF